MLKKINKQKARRFFNEGKEIIVVPCKCVPVLDDVKGFDATITLTNKHEKDFDKVFNEYAFYNLEYAELGKRAHFYINE